MSKEKRKTILIDSGVVVSILWNIDEAMHYLQKCRPRGGWEFRTGMRELQRLKADLRKWEVETINNRLSSLEKK